MVLRKDFQTEKILLQMQHNSYNNICSNNASATTFTPIDNTGVQDGYAVQLEEGVYYVRGQFVRCKTKDWYYQQILDLQIQELVLQLQKV